MKTGSLLSVSIRGWLRLVAALPRCAVSQICNLRRIATGQRLGSIRHSAEYNSAIRQIENLRHEARYLAKQIRRARAAHCVHQIRSLFGALVHAAVRREGAPNCSRGGCAPHSFQLHRSGYGNRNAR
jgi:hypothetical protein